MDRMDYKILDVLQKAPGISNSELSERVGLSHTPCWRRLKKLEELGAIRGRFVLLDPDVLGLSVSVFAEVQLKQHDEEVLKAFEASVRALPEIVDCFSMSGQRDYQLRIVVRDVAQYEHFLKKVLLHLPGIGSINSSFALKSIKQTTCLPLNT